MVTIHIIYILYIVLFSELCCPYIHKEKAMTPHSSTPAWKIPWTEEPGRLQSMGLLKVRQDWATSLSLFTFMHWKRKWQPTPVFLPGESQGQGSLVAAVYGVTQSQTRLKRLSSSSIFINWSPNPWYDGTWGWVLWKGSRFRWGHESGSSWWDQFPWKKNTRQLTIHHVRTLSESVQARNRAFTTTRSCRSQDLGLLASRILRQ